MPFHWNVASFPEGLLNPFSASPNHDTFGVSPSGSVIVAENPTDSPAPTVSSFPGLKNGSGFYHGKGLGWPLPEKGC